MSKVKVGDIYGRLTVVALISHSKNPRALCICECGKECSPQRGSLVNGRAKSCGCLGREHRLAAVKTHGLSNSAEYRIFQAMRRRCSNPEDPHFQNYGGRGIRVLWNSFEEFYADMGPKPQRAWIDRKNNDGHYEKGNCFWVTPAENQKNKRVCKYWTIAGIEYETSTDAARALGVTPSVVIRGCNGYTRNGKVFAPRDGWSSRLKYEKRGLIEVAK